MSVHDLSYIRKFEGDVRSVSILDSPSFFPYEDKRIFMELHEMLEGLEGRYVKITVEVERTCSCGAKTFHKSGMCYECEKKKLDFEANYS